MIHVIDEILDRVIYPVRTGRLACAGLTGFALLFSAGCGSVSGAMTRGQEPVDLNRERLGKAIYQHEGNYIVAGGSPDTTAKYQLSLKVRMAGRVFFGYSQTNLWDISRASLPFRDTTHRPSVFYYGAERPIGSGGTYRTVYGLEHNSNGRDELSSRSLNQLFYQPILTIGETSSRYWRVSAKLYAYVGKGDNNQDIDDFRTNFELRVLNAKQGGASYSVWWRPGKSGRGRGTAEFSTGLRKLGWDVPGALMIQLFAGYSETLLDYDRRERPQLRIGYRLDGGG